MMKHCLKAAAAIAVCAGHPVAADVVTKTKLVSYADLDLATAAGQAKLEKRVMLAAVHVCGPRRPLDLNSMREVRECRRAAVADARPQIAQAIAERARNERLAATSIGVTTAR